MSISTNLPDLPVPAGAVSVHDWDGPDTDDPTRYVQATRVIIPTHQGDVAVWWGGLQRPDSSVELEICVSELHPDKPLTVGEARQIASAMIQAADNAERNTEG